MPKVLLTAKRVEHGKCLNGSRKLDLFDTRSPGLMLEIRASGGKTYYLRYNNARGRTRQLRLANARDITLSQARQLADRARNAIAMGEDPRDAKDQMRKTPLFSTFIHEQYMPHVKGYKRSWKTDESILKNHLLPVLGQRYMDEITRHDIARIHLERKAQGKAASTANRILIIASHIFNLALKWKVPGVKENPTKDIAAYQENNKRERYLSVQEAKRLYEAVCESANPMLRYIVPMLVMTGCRRAEVIGACWKDIDMERRLWRVPLTKSGFARHVPLSDGALQILRTVPRNARSRYVFANPKTGEPFSSIYESWDTARKKAQLKDVRIHDLRHSFASLLVNEGRSLYEVQKILGHSQLKTTQRYAHLANATLVDAANAATRAVGHAMGFVALVEVQ